MKEIKTELYEQFEKESASASDKTFLNKLFKETKAEVSRPKKDRVKVEITQNRYPKPLVMTYEYHSTQFERMNLFVFKKDCYQYGYRSCNKRKNCNSRAYQRINDVIGTKTSCL